MLDWDRTSGSTTSVSPARLSTVHCSVMTSPTWYMALVGGDVIMLATAVSIKPTCTKTWLVVVKCISLNEEFTVKQAYKL